MTNTPDWNDDCEWPRRLLHVPTMTSYLWQPENVYGNHVSPLYNAISYTWGRWQIRDGDHPNVKALDVTGVDWNIPRVDPSHFTADELLSTIRTAISVSASAVDSMEFIWLDIACIDQRQDSKENAREVGRQAKIFKKASNVFAWLTSFESNVSFGAWHEKGLTAFAIYRNPSLQGVLLDLNATSRMPRPNSTIETMLEQVSRLLLEPWCSSLWTLQESFLRPDTKLLYRNHDDLPQVLPDLEHGFQWINDLMSDIQASGPTEYGLLRDLESKIKTLGFILAGHVDRLDPAHNNKSDHAIDDTPLENPLLILTSSKTRITSHEEDRVYAIMQVFDLRLGKSAPDATRMTYTYDELKTQLDNALLHKYPIASQLVIQPAHCELGSGWMIHPDGVVSTTGEQLWASIKGGSRINTLAALSTVTHQGRLWGLFKGPTIHLSALDSKLYTLQLDKCFQISEAEAEPVARGHRQSTREDWNNNNRTPVDWNDPQQEIVESWRRRESRRKEAASFERQKVNNEFPNLKVLHLGTTDDRIEDQVWFTACGLCINPVENSGQHIVYQRIGTIVFTASETYNSSRETLGIPPLLNDSGQEWRLNDEGIFG